MIFTIDSDDDIEPELESEEEEEIVKRGSKRGHAKASPQISFDFDDGRLTESSLMKAGANDGEYNESDEDEDDEDELDDGVVKSMPRTEERAQRAMEKKKLASKKKEEAGGESESSDNEGAEDEDEDDGEDEKGYFDTIVESNEAAQVEMFSQFNLSRPLLRAVEAMGYTAPTEVQAKVIPLALAGRDVCASALTGSGKTAAFVIPFLERLLYRPKDQAAIRVIVVSPTRELAMQTFEVVQKLSKFTDITSVLICGGKKDVRSQSVQLQKRPDIVIGTPGRLIDHLMNTSAVRVDMLDILVLDEVDRLLDLGFQDEIEELVKHCPKSRQTLLFSATMTSKVDDLAKLSLKRPVRVKTLGNASTTALRLVQEFIRLRKEDEKEAILAAVLCRASTTRTIAFFETKKEAHRFHIVLSLLGAKSAEMHGDLPQIQRNHALQQFKNGAVNVLIATDVASRGIDITGVHCVVNAEMPRSVSTYIHRVGRTARAGSSGRSVTIVSDVRRKVLKSLLKGGEAVSLVENADQNILQRTIPSAVITQYTEKIAELEEEIQETMATEGANRQIDEAMMEAERAENMLQYEEEIKSRPSRAWYQSEKEKKAVAEASKEASKRALDEIDEDGDPVEEETKRAKKERTVGKDEYLDDRDSKPKKKVLSRKKRRRLDALGGGDDDDGDNGSSKKEPAFTGKKKLLEQRDKVKAVSDARDKQKKKINKEKVFEQKAAKEAKKQKNLAKGIVDDDDVVKMSYKQLRKGGKQGANQFKSKAKYKRR
jgi:ATP-dependent RNA helicase DDX27